MIQGWESTNNPFDDGDTESPPQVENVDHTANNNDTMDSTPPPPPPPPPPAQEPGMFREWERASRRYEEEEEKVEITAEDPLASPGNLSLNGSISGWSIGAGMVDKESIGDPFDVEDEEDDSEEDEEVGSNDNRSSSPRQGYSKSHGLSMVKEEGDNGGGGVVIGNANNGTMFDDVDLEAFPKNLPTSSHKSNGSGNKHSGSSGRRKAASITDRVLHEWQTNPNLKFKVIVGISVMLVISCLLAVIIATSSSKQTAVNQEDGVANVGSSILPVTSDTTTPEILPVTADTTAEPSKNPSKAPTKLPTVQPTSKPTTNSPTESPSDLPTFNPTTYPTNEAAPTSYPTPTLTSLNPSFSPTTTTPTYSPSGSPITFSPTRDCTDELGDFMTSNDKLRDCTWLDNGYNGATSTRKDTNCLNSVLGDACKYTCRLYNGCMEYLLSSLPEYTNENDVSIGNSCEDKDGLFMSNGNVPRECTWLEEDGEAAAPMKKNLNCGTPDIPRTELGIMCPASCAGYNDCAIMSNGVAIKLVSPHPLVGLAGDGETADSDNGDNVEDIPTPFPTIGSSDPPTTFEERCQDKDGEFSTHTGTLRQCRWLNRDDVEEKKLLNCNITEIGLNCLESCPCNKGVMATAADSISGMLTTPARTSAVPSGVPTYLPTLAPTTFAPTPFPDSKGIFDESGHVLTLTVLADASVSQENADKNFGDSSRLYVANDPDTNVSQRQTFLLFDLKYVAKSFGGVTGVATLRFYSINGSDSGGVTLKKMEDTNWTEEDVTWNTIPGGDGTDEPIISFVDSLDSNTWYDIDVTAAVRAALENNESHLGIRIVSEDEVDVYFGSKEREDQPRLIVDSRTWTYPPTVSPSYEPTYQPTMSPSYEPTANPTTWEPTFSPTLSPSIELKCMDKEGTFTTHKGESQPCSWLDAGNGSLKKDFNCKDSTLEASLFCQAKCSAYNGCDEMHCEDMSGTYATHTGWTAQCSWLLIGPTSTLKLEQNCGTDGNPITELGKRCQATCGEYNGCGI